LTTVPIHYSEAFVHDGATFDTHVKARLVAARAGRDPRFSIVEPRAATFEELAPIHSSEYLEALRSGRPPSLARSSGFFWSSALVAGALASAGGVRDAALRALADGGITGSLSSGLHHAGWARGRGYCTVNGLALAAVAAVEAGARRVLILDLDAHGGGGTAEIIRRHSGIEQLDLTVEEYDLYDSDAVARLVLPDPGDYLGSLTMELAAVRDPASIDLILYNAGVDPHEQAGGVRGITDETIVARERAVFEWARGIPLAFVLAGGYAQEERTLDAVADLHFLTLDAAAEASREADEASESGAPPPPHPSEGSRADDL
jgi:acetoin utilization deacetylase AcuC-like enzyme